MRNMSIFRRGFAGILLLFGACIDFREGLQCQEDADCQGLVCASGRCASSDDRFSVVGIVVEDNNNDEVLSPGESAGFAIRLTKKNSGSTEPKPITGIIGSLTTRTPGVTVTSGQDLQFGDLNDGYYSCGTIPAILSKGSCNQSKAGYPNITIAPTVPANTSISFILSLKDSRGDSFMVRRPEKIS